MMRKINISTLIGILASIILLYVATQPSTVSAGEYRKNYYIMYEGTHYWGGVPPNPPSWQPSPIDDIDLRGESELAIEFVLSENTVGFSNVEWIKVYGYNKNNEVVKETLTIDGVGTYQTAYYYASLKQPYPIELDGRAVCSLLVQHKKGGGVAGGREPAPPWYQVRWDQIRELLKTKVQAPMWALTQGHVNFEGLVLTALFGGLLIVAIRYLHRFLFKKKERLILKVKRGW